MEVVYVSAPYSHANAKMVEARMDLFCLAVSRLIPRGLATISPLYNHYVLRIAPELGKDWAAWKEYSKTLVLQAQRLIVLQMEGWEKSEGVAEEMKLATKHGIPITYIRDFKTFKEEKNP